MYRILPLLLFSLLLRGQTGPDVPQIMYSEGVIEFTETGSRKPIRVYTSDYLPRPGQLTLPRGGYVELATRNQYVKLDQPGQYSVGDLFSKKPRAPGFLRPFLEFISRGWDESATSEDLERAYEKNQGNAQGNISGYGDAGLAGLLPFGGTLYSAPTTFSWPAEPGAPSYRLRIVDSLTESVLAAVTTRDTLIELDLPNIQLADGRRYYWEVFPNAAPSATPSRLGLSAPTVAGTRIYFTYRDTPRASILLPLDSLPYYRQTASDGLRSLMEAVLLENEDYLYAADRAYRDGMLAEPGNAIIRRNYAAFLSRWNQRAAARQLLNKP